jgi:hypothetical protein
MPYICKVCHTEFDQPAQVKGKKMAFCPEGHRMMKVMTFERAIMTCVLLFLALMVCVPFFGNMFGPTVPTFGIAMLWTVAVAVGGGIGALIHGILKAKSTPPLLHSSRAGYGWAVGSFLALASISLFWYSRYIKPVAIQEVAYTDDYMFRELSIEGKVTEPHTNDTGGYYTLTDETGSILVRASATDNLPKADQKIWVLGYVGQGSGGHGVFEHWKIQMRH